MLPKIIHYCWFGDNPLPDDAKEYIESWKLYCPDYEIREWNENNFNLKCCSYVEDAYKAKKWAFVSDYARFWILYYFGGIYFDTDVEMIKPIDDIIESGSFMGIEAGPKVLVAPGLGIGAEKGNEIMKEIVDYYNTQSFYEQDGSINKTTVVTRVSEILRKKGYKGTGEQEKVGNITIYPADYFCPMNYHNGKTMITSNTRTIHHYAETWHNPAEKKIDSIRRKLYDTRLREGMIEKVLILPFRVWNKVINVRESRK